MKQSGVFTTHKDFQKQRVAGRELSIVQVNLDWDVKVVGIPRKEDSYLKTCNAKNAVNDGQISRE
jgi:hypothetical protein